MKDFMWTLNFKSVLFALLLVGGSSYAQTGWTWTPKTQMIMPVANNAVASGDYGQFTNAFSFGGIDTTKIWTGQTRRAFMYHYGDDQWYEIDSLPVALPLIASSASTVKNKIYIIGGYHVYQNGSETSSDEVIVFNPATLSYEANGSPVPIPIDDQVQCVWRDSLIYVISGWSNSGNVDDVQIYDPALDQWQSGTPVPNTNEFKVFGGSGEIIGDTIYYYGGASTGINFPATNIIRKGIINENDPTQINWIFLDNAPSPNYRSACITHGENVFWVGGSEVSYNYNGIAYNGTGGVSPSFKINRLATFYNDWFEGTGSPYGVMDLRGAGKVSTNEWIICGGMDTAQIVSDRTFLLTYDPVVGSLNEPTNTPSFKIVNRELIFENPVKGLKLISLDGKLISELPDSKIDRRHTGIFILEFQNEHGVFREKISIK